MSLVTLDQVKAQSRITATAEDTLLQEYVDAAEQMMVNFLNRNVYADGTALLDAITQAQTDLETAKADFDTAIAAAQTLDCGPLREIAFEKACGDWDNAKEAYRMAAYGATLQPAMVQAVMLIVAGWYANRESVTTDVIQLPLGTMNLLAPFRVRMGG